MTRIAAVSGVEARPVYVIRRGLGENMGIWVANGQLIELGIPERTIHHKVEKQQWKTCVAGKNFEAVTRFANPILIPRRSAQPTPLTLLRP